jgi:AraC-like DNA-binding protein
MSCACITSQPHWDVNIMRMIQETSVICRYVVSEGFSYGPHCHVGIGICYCTQGQGTFTVANHILPFGAGSLIYYSAQLAHSVVIQGTYERWDVCFWLKGLMKLRWDDTLNRLITEFIRTANEVSLFKIPEIDHPRLDRTFRSIREENVSRRYGFETVLQLYLAELHLLLQRTNHEGAQAAISLVNPVTDDIIISILQYIEDNSPITVNQIADRFSYHPSQIFRLIRRATGLSPSRYLQDRRLVRAKSLLIRSDLSVTAIAKAVGFCQVSHFSHIFRLYTGQTPTEYRLENQA